MTNEVNDPAPVGDKTLQLLDELDRRWATLPPVKPTGPGVHDMTVPMTIEAMTRWLVLCGVAAADLDGYLLQYAGKTWVEMDEIYDELHASMA